VTQRATCSWKSSAEIASRMPIDLVPEMSIVMTVRPWMV